MAIDIVKLQVIKDGSVYYNHEPISCPKALAEIGKKFIGNCDREMFLLVCLDSRNMINALHVVSIGCLSTAPVHPREVFKAAILCNSAAIALIHNHPSGDTMPSNEDIEVTRRLIKCAELFGIRLHDHVILGERDTFFSFYEKGLLKVNVD